MHFYPFNVGDYASHTRYLSPLQDIVYRRLMDNYYTDETPPAGDFAAIAQSIGMPENIAEVEYILNRYFKQDGEVWRQKRIDNILAEYKQKQAANDEKKKNEAERQRKHREKRSSLFAELSEKGIYPEWNTPTKELVTMLSRVTGDRVTRDVTAINNKQETINNKQYNIVSATPLQDDFCLPLKSGKVWIPDNDFLQVIKTAYPTIEINEEFQRMKAWLISNPNKQKTQRGIKGFVNSWLSRAKPKPAGELTHEQDFVDLHTSTDWSKDL